MFIICCNSRIVTHHMIYSAAQYLAKEAQIQFVKSWCTNGPKIYGSWPFPNECWSCTCILRPFQKTIFQLYISLISFNVGHVWYPMNIEDGFDVNGNQLNFIFWLSEVYKGLKYCWPSRFLFLIIFFKWNHIEIFSIRKEDGWRSWTEAGGCYCRYQ